jgi:hypothetical protein
MTHADLNARVTTLTGDLCRIMNFACLIHESTDGSCDVESEDISSWCDASSKGVTHLGVMHLRKV